MSVSAISTGSVLQSCQPQAIKNKGDHFLGLNSPYFEYTFTTEEIDKLYYLSRDLAASAERAFSSSPGLRASNRMMGCMLPSPA